MRVLTSLTAGCMITVFSTLATAADTGDLKIKFQYGGKSFKPKPIQVNKDVNFCGQQGLVDEKLLVNEQNQGIQNVIVYVYTGRGGSKIDKVDPVGNTHTLANSKCRFEPHIVIAQTGDKLKVTNPDTVGHNANMNFFENKAENLMIPAGKEQLVALEKPEPAPIPIDCNIHPWMKAYVMVLEHPYAALSDENGELVIKGLPAGEELTFRVFHEAGAINDVTVDGKKTKWKRSRFELEIEPGENDMGTVVVPADQFE